LCGLCAWQWNREEQLRELSRVQLVENAGLRKELEESVTRAKAADAEILRLTAALNEIKTASIAKTQYDEALEAARTMREGVLKQNAALKDQQEALLKSQAAVSKANQTIEKLTTERDSLGKKLNSLTLEYNKLVKRLQPDAPQNTPPRDAAPPQPN
jgi:chromosome segregation ATPase